MKRKSLYIMACFLLIYTKSIYTKEILLNKINNVTLRGSVNSVSINNIIRDLITKCSAMTDHDRLYDRPKTTNSMILKTNDSMTAKTSTEQLLPSFFGKENINEAENDRSPVILSRIDQVVDSIKNIFKNKKKPIIYMTLDTPGGSVFDGIDLIRVMRSLPCEVHTISLEADSMGFKIAQASAYRYMTMGGTHMSHRASLGRIGGTLDGELESRIDYIKQAVEMLNVIAAAKIGITVEQYKEKIRNEWWLVGEEAVKQGTADEMAELSCDQELLEDTYTEEQSSFFGSVILEWSSCPLLRSPISSKSEIRSGS